VLDRRGRRRHPGADLVVLEDPWRASATLTALTRCVLRKRGATGPAGPPSNRALDGCRECATAARGPANSRAIRRPRKRPLPRQRIAVQANTGAVLPGFDDHEVQRDRQPRQWDTV